MISLSVCVSVCVCLCVCVCMCLSVRTEIRQIRILRLGEERLRIYFLHAACAMGSESFDIIFL